MCIADWLAERSPRGVSHWLAAFDDALRRLEQTPGAYPSAPENEFVEGWEIRHVVFKTRAGRPYRALFTIVGDEVRVLHVRGPGQSPVSSQDLSSNR